MSLADKVFPFNGSNFPKWLGRSGQADYIYRYLKSLGAKTCILEKDYVDKDYLVEGFLLHFMPFVSITTIISG